MGIKVFTAFSGYDSQCLALNRIDIDYNLVGWSEIDRYAIQAHNALFPAAKNLNYGDISGIDWKTVPDFDLFTYSSPCQDFSQAGLQRGGEKGSGTRSSLLWECERAISIKRPKFLLMENVAALVSKKFVKLFNRWQLTLERLGYRNFAKILNSSDYGVPQNRERIFLVSVLGDDTYYFPQPILLKKRLKDLLEVNADEKYYIRNTTTDGLARTIICHYGKAGFAKLLNPTHDKSTYIEVVGNLQPDNKWNGNVIRQQNFILGTNGVSKAITAEHYKHQFKIIENKSIRKLTPKECFRLMGLLDDEIDTIQKTGISNSMQYKLAGNSIVIDVLAAIFRKMFIDKKNDNQQLSLF